MIDIKQKRTIHLLTALREHNQQKSVKKWLSQINMVVQRHASKLQNTHHIIITKWIGVELQHIWNKKVNLTTSEKSAKNSKIPEEKKNQNRKNRTPLHRHWSEKTKPIITTLIRIMFEIRNNICSWTLNNNELNLNGASLAVDSVSITLSNLPTTRHK